MSNLITRAELVKTYKVAIKKIAELKNKKYCYKTNRSCEPFGQVKSMSIEDVVKAGATVHDGDANIQARIEQYGILPSDLKNGDPRKYLGFTVDEWDHDFKLRVTQIHDAATLEKYEKAAEKLSANFTADDRFLIEMGEIDELGLDLADDTVEVKDNTAVAE